MDRESTSMRILQLGEDDGWYGARRTPSILFVRLHLCPFWDGHHTLFSLPGNFHRVKDVAILVKSFDVINGLVEEYPFGILVSYPVSGWRRRLWVGYCRDKIWYKSRTLIQFPSLFAVRDWQKVFPGCLLYLAHYFEIHWRWNGILASSTAIWK